MSRRDILAGVILLGMGAANLALGNPVLGWAGMVLGAAGLGAVLGVQHGWITPRTTAGRRRPRPAPPDPAPAVDRPVPHLSEDGRERVAGIVSALHAAGVLVPEAPDPADLYEAVADQGEPVTVDAVLAALHEAPVEWPANLVCHETQVEQFEDTLRRQIDDLVRLAGGALAVDVRDVRLDFSDGSRQVPTRIRWTVNGSEQTLAYTGASKYPSTVIHVTLARAMAGAPRRLASLWSDQGMWITTLPEGGVERLNAALGLDADSPSYWEWVDGEEPMAAGDV
jgi:hypothetical protein